jgi:hypothetical protein
MMEDLSIPGPKDKSPRVLRITYELRVPRALQRNIQWPHVLEAINRITGAVQSAASAAFPWAYEVRVRYEWLYAWGDLGETLALPETDDNTPADTASG